MVSDVVSDVVSEAVSGAVPAAPEPSTVSFASFVSSMSFVTALMMYASSVERHCARG
jgi:hypothetical protein